MCRFQAVKGGGGAAAAFGAAMMVWMLICLVIAVVMIVSMWKVFTKAGKPGWAAIVPFYNFYVLLQVAGQPWWWLILVLIPFVNYVTGLIAGVLISLGLAKRFGKGTGFAVGLFLLPVIFCPILAFGSATYVGDGSQVQAPAQA